MTTYANDKVSMTRIATPGSESCEITTAQMTGNSPFLDDFHNSLFAYSIGGAMHNVGVLAL
jgi:hypothetical protein